MRKVLSHIAAVYVILCNCAAVFLSGSYLSYFKYQVLVERPVRQRHIFHSFFSV